MTGTDRLVGRWLNGAIALVGAWIVAAAFLFDASGGQFVNDLVVGGSVTILALGAWALARTSGEDEQRSATTWALGLASLLGVWMILSPIPFETSGYKVSSDVLAGLVVALLSGYQAYTRAGFEENTLKTGDHPSERTST